jgi:hypothetical protein
VRHRPVGARGPCCASRSSEPLNSLRTLRAGRAVHPLYEITAKHRAVVIAVMVLETLEFLILYDPSIQESPSLARAPEP